MDGTRSRCEGSKILFYEYFDVDNGAGISASHQTGWTGFVATLIQLFGRLQAAQLLEMGRAIVFLRAPAAGGGGMRQASALVLCAVVALLGCPEAGRAQAPQSIRFQAIIRSVDCNAMTVTLDSAGRIGVYHAVSAATFFVNSAGVALCNLRQYIGVLASVWLTAVGNELLITQIDIGGLPGGTSAPPPPVPVPYTSPPAVPAGPAPSYTYPAPAPAPSYTYPAPAPYPFPAPYVYTYLAPAPYPYYYYTSAAAVVLGSIIVGGLAYLLVRGANGYLYHYPYYGSYYRYYYRPAYAPYYGPYRYAPAYRWCYGYRSYGSWCR